MYIFPLESENMVWVARKKKKQTQVENFGLEIWAKDRFIAFAAF